MKKPRLHVSDHAVLRYLERAGGFDIEALRRSIGQRCEPAYRIGASSLVIEGIAFLIHNGVVITALEAQTMECRIPWERRR